MELTYSGVGSQELFQVHCSVVFNYSLTHYYVGCLKNESSMDALEILSRFLQAQKSVS